MEQRHHESHYQEHRHDPDIARSIIRLKQTPDGRYTPSEGRYPSYENEIESTYLIRPPYEGNYNLVLPPFRPNPGTSFQIPARLSYSKLFKDKPYQRNRLNHNSVYPDFQVHSQSLNTYIASRIPAPPFTIILPSYFSAGLVSIDLGLFRTRIVLPIDRLRKRTQQRLHSRFSFSHRNPSHLVPV